MKRTGVALAFLVALLGLATGAGIVRITEGAIERADRRQRNVPPRSRPT